MNKKELKEARHWMWLHVAKYVDGCTNEINCTKLAEDCSDDLDHPEWCDEPGDTGLIWELSFDVACKFEKQGERK